jgi:hypothetical protein
MATNETRTLEEFGTTAESTDDNPRAECWCGEEDLACWDHYRAERNLRGEY